MNTQSIEPLPHTWGNWNVTLQPTCTQEGEQTHVCQVCGYGETKIVGKIAHAFGDWTVIVEPTCTNEGMQTHVCTACGLEESENVPPRGHRFGAWNTIAEMTDFSIGVRERACERCGKVEHEEQEPRPTYRRGDRGDGVKGLQEALNVSGFNCGAADGIFGKKTEAAVKAVEQAHDFQADGIAWPGVQKWLGMAGGMGPDDVPDFLPDDLASTYAGGAPGVPATFEDAGEKFSARTFEVIDIPEAHSAYYAGATVIVKLRLTIDNYDSYRVVKCIHDYGDNFYANDWVYAGKPLEPGKSYDMTYGMVLKEDTKTWNKRRITLELKSLTTGAIEYESVEFGPPWKPAKVTIIDQNTASHIAGDSLAFLYLKVDESTWPSRIYLGDMIDLPINVDSDGTVEIRNIRLTVKQVNTDHNEIFKTDEIKLKNKIMPGDSFDWLARVLATMPDPAESEPRALRLQLSGVYDDKKGNPQIVESQVVTLTYNPVMKSEESPSLSLDYYLKPAKNVYGPGDRVTVCLTVLNDGQEPLENVSLGFFGPSIKTGVKAKWEAIEGFPEGTTLMPGETAEATWSYTLRREDFENDSFEADFLVRGSRQKNGRTIAAPSAHVTIPCSEFLREYISLTAQVKQKSTWYPAGTSVPVTLTVKDITNRKLLRTRLYSVGDNWQTNVLTEKAWRDFGHGAKGYKIGEMGAIDYGFRTMVVYVDIPEDFAGNVYRAAWVVEGDYYDDVRSARSNVAWVELPVFHLADEKSELSLDVEQRSLCPHEDGIWRSGDVVDVKLTAEYKRGGAKAKRLSIQGTDMNGETVATLMGENMNTVSDIVQLTLDDNLFRSARCTFSFRAKADSKTAGRTDYITGVHTLTFDMKPQQKATVTVNANIISENLNPDGKWCGGDKARISMNAVYDGAVIPRRMEYVAYVSGHEDSPVAHSDVWYSKGITDEFVVQLNSGDKVDDKISYHVVVYVYEGESEVRTCDNSMQVVFEMSPSGSGPDMAGTDVEEMPAFVSTDGIVIDSGHTEAWVASMGGEYVGPVSSETSTETGSESAETSETGTEIGNEGSETPETGSESGETPETVTETGNEGGETIETGTETGSVSGETPNTGTETGNEGSETSETGDEPGYEEIIVTIAGEAYDIPATICLPKGDGPFPAIVMLHGTGSTRDEAGDGYRYAVPVLAEKYGIATIRIDFPGNGDSTADYMQYNFHSAVADAKAAADYIASLDCIDGNAIGVMGWSQGGTDALLACAWQPDTFRSVVTWAGAPDMMLDGFFSEEDYVEAKENGFFVMEFDWRDSLNVSLEWCDDVANTDVLREFSKGYTGSVLAIAGTDDDTVDPRWSVKIADASPNPLSRTCFIEGMDHTFNVFGEKDLHSLFHAVDATGAFFAQTLIIDKSADTQD